MRGFLQSRRVARALRSADRARDAGDWTTAARFYRGVIDLAPERAPIWVQLGNALKEGGDAAAAEAAYRRAMHFSPDHADAYLQLGHLMKLASRWTEAADCYARAANTDPDLNDAAAELQGLSSLMIERGDRARDAGDWPLAALHYRGALDMRPGLTPIWVQLAHALKEQGEYREAEAAYCQALALDPAAADTSLHLGHVLKLQHRRAEAVAAYAAAVNLDPALGAAREALHAILGYAPMDIAMALQSARTGAGTNALASEAGNDRHDALLPLARRRSGGHDVIWLGVVDWHYRLQRPQHLATHIAELGARVFYVSLAFEAADERGCFRIVDMPHPGVYEVRLRLVGSLCESVFSGLSAATIAQLQRALRELAAAFDLDRPIVIVEQPGWHRVARGIPAATLVYDCLDLATGFSNVGPSLAAAEAELIATAGLVVAASEPLAQRLAPRRAATVIRNAAEFNFFAAGRTERLAGEHPVIGYFGAIADWFAIEWIEACAAAHPEWRFDLVGRADCDTARAASRVNVRFRGEKPYRDLPRLLRQFDVAIIPFRIVDLTRCTNPVKLYEYMAAGKAVVASPMPEVVAATDLVYIAEDPRSFAERIAQALAEDSPALRDRRQEWARGHTWPDRATRLLQAIAEARSE